jgi:aldose 1-epimerase
MSFSISNSKENDLDLVNITDEGTGTVVSLLPAYGAIVHSFRIRLRDGSLFDVMDSYSGIRDLKAGIDRWYKGAKLSPWPCRIPDGLYTFSGREYRLEHLFSDGTAIHGLLYDKPFSVSETAGGDNEGSVLLDYNYNKEDGGYPFHYSCQVRYTLRAGGELEVVTTVTNLDNTAVPMADGWHPYFKLGGKIDDWQLQFHSEAIVDFDDRLVPTGQLTSYDTFGMPRKVGDTSFDNCFVLKPGLVSAVCELFNPDNGLRVSFYPDTRYPYLQIYTPLHRSSIAVENLSSAPNSFNNKMGLLILETGHSQIFTVKYKVSVE